MKYLKWPLPLTDNVRVTLNSSKIMKTSESLHEHKNKSAESQFWCFFFFLQRMLILGAFHYSLLAVLNYHRRGQLLFMMAADWGWDDKREGTSQEHLSRCRSSPLCLWCTNRAHLDLLLARNQSLRQKLLVWKEHQWALLMRQRHNKTLKGIVWSCLTCSVK